MNVDDAITVLGAIAAAAKVGTAVVTVYNWLTKSRPLAGDPNLNAALARLPKTATADDIVRVVTPFMSSPNGDVLLGGGNNGGGNIRAENVNIQGGSGSARAGNVLIIGGDGGPDGKGGDVTIVGGTIKGGDAPRH